MRRFATFRANGNAKYPLAQPPSMQSLLTELIDSLVAFPSEIGAVATNSVVGAVLVATGTLLMLVSFGVLGYLTLGALVDLVIPDSTGRSPPRAGR